MGKITIQGSATDLNVLESLSPTDLFAPNGTDPVFEAINKEVAAFVPDVTTDGGRKEIASMAYKIAQSKNFLDKVGKIFNSDLKEKTKAVDVERAAIWDKLQALQDKISKPLDDYKAAEELRVQAHKDAMGELENISMFFGDPTALQIDDAIKRASELKVRDWEEFVEMVNPVFETQWAKLMGMKATAEQRAKDQAELEALRAAKAAQDAKDAEVARQKAAAEERARIEQEAAEKAQRDAEAAIQAEKDKAAKAATDAAAALKASEEKAAREKSEADDRLKKAEEARIAAEAKAKLEADAAVQREKDRATAEKKRKDAEALARENDRAHHAKVNNEAATAIKRVIAAVKGDEEVEKFVVTAIARGDIPHIKISY